MSKKITSLVVASAAIAMLGTVAVSSDAVAGKKDKEKCYGIVAKGQNDCGTPKHSCAGVAAVDNDPQEWIYVPKGLCKKITGSSTGEPK